MTHCPPIRIVVCTKQDIEGALILNRIVPRLAGHQVMVLLSDKTRTPEVNVPELSILKYLERDLPINTLFPLVDALGPDTTGKKLTFNGLSRRYGISFHVTHDVNSDETMAVIGDFAPDIMVSVRFSSVFKAPVMAIPRLGVFNIHPGALPQYAGLFPSFRAMVNGETKIGCSLHRVDARIDAGPLLGIGWTDMIPERGLLWHVFKSYNAGLDMFVDVLPDLIAGRSVAETPQDETLRAYRSMPTPEQIRLFVQRGFHWFDPLTYSEAVADFLPLGIGGPPCP